ncbi:MAG: diguanylate cyclase [Chloroflexi bacterium]|nr:diguanylate cyclase [Chloroflexota bacterium]
MDTISWVIFPIIIISISIILYRNNKKNKAKDDVGNQSLHRWQALFEQTNDAVLILRLDQHIMAANGRASDILGYGDGELVGKSRRDILSPENWEDTMVRQYKILSGVRIPAYEREYIKKNGERIWMEASTSLVIDPEGNPLHFQSIMRDITERKKLEKELNDLLAEMERQAMTDHLTGLLNRRALTEHANAELNRANREKKPLCILLLDIDSLKSINDHYGHLSGDQAIKLLAENLKKWKRQYDWVGRWGGDEFMVVLPGVDVKDAEMIAKRLFSRIGELDFEYNSEIIKIQISIGVTGLDKEDDNDTFDKLLSRADQALYISKRDKDVKVTVYSE